MFHLIHIPLNDIRRQNAVIGAELQAAAQRVYERGWYILGPEVEAFEAEYATYCGARFCVGVGNGTDALELALRALDLQPGAGVATVANAGMYATTAILAAGLTPVYVDVDANTMNMNAGCLAAIPPGHVEAVIVTHLYGRMADMPELLRAARDVPVLEDCAQAHGAILGSHGAGTWGIAGCFSFYPTKNLGALGDGGAVVTNDERIASRSRALRQYGWNSGKYRSELPGGRNSRLDELQAAFLRAKLPHLDGWNQRRRVIAARYSEALGQQAQANDRSYVAHLFVTRSPDRDALRAGLRESGISTDIHYPIPDYRQPSVIARFDTVYNLPVTEACCREVLTLPCFPELTNSEVNAVSTAISSTSVPRLKP